MSLCINCNLLDASEGFTNCLEGYYTINGGCIHFKDNGSALTRQVGGTHYQGFKISPVEFCQKNKLNFCESNIIKYICRHAEKNGLQDLEKIKHYVDLLIEIEYSKGE